MDSFSNQKPVFFADGVYAGEIVEQAAPRPVEDRSPLRFGHRVSGAAKALVRRAQPRLDHGKPAHGRHFERYAETAEAIIHIAMIKLMTRRLARFVNS
jgi:hypothetical protein